MDPAPDPSRLLSLVVAAGPATGRVLALPVGRHLVGRASGCAVRLDDLAVEAHHALVTVEHHGGALTIDVLQLSGRHPVLADGEPVGPAATRVGRSLEMGHTRLAVGPPSQTAGIVLGVAADGSPVTFDLGRRAVEVVGITHDPRDPATLVVARSVAAGLLSRCERATSTEVHVVEEEAVADARSGPHAAEETLVLAVVPHDSPALPHCTARLDVGARWRGRWTADTRRPLHVVRLHLLGDQPTPSGRSSLSR